METDFQAQLDGRLDIALDDLREKSEGDIADYKVLVEAVYRDKVCEYGYYLCVFYLSVICEVKLGLQYDTAQSVCSVIYPRMEHSFTLKCSISVVLCRVIL